MNVRCGIGALALLGLLASEGSVSAEIPTLEACARLVLDQPDRLESYMCYWFVARRGDPDGAMRALEAQLALDPENHRARLYLGAIHADLGHDEAKDLFREAAAGFAEMEEHTGEVYARLSLRHQLERAQRWEEAEREIDAAERAAVASQDRYLLARVRGARAKVLMRRGDYAEALAILHENERTVFPDGPVDMRAGILHNLAHAYQKQGLVERALELYDRRAEIMREAGDAHEESIARMNWANLAGSLVQSDRARTEEILEVLRRAIETSRQVGNTTGVAWGHLLLARFEPGPEAIEHAERSLETYRAIHHRRGAQTAMRQLAVLLWMRHPERRAEARRLLEEAIEDARSGGAVEEVVRGRAEKAALLLRGAPREEWLVAFDEALDAIEKLRDLRPRGVVGARIFSQWTDSYYRIAGALLERLPESPDPDADLERAFRIVERMRTRLILDELDGAGARPRTSELPDAALRREILDEIAAVQKRLADPALPAAPRVEDLAKLERLEVEEMRLRVALARSDPVFAEWRMPAIPTIAEVQEHLAPDQAILSFQVAEELSGGAHPVSRGGSWMLAITREGVREFRLPDRQELRRRVGVYLGLCRRRDGEDAVPGAWLYEDLLADALDRMGPEIRSLILVPDDCLHRLPFSALRPGPGAEPLGVTYRLSRIPSVTSWIGRADRGGGAPAGGAGPVVFALADPALHTGGVADRMRSAAPWLKGVDLGALPRARREARALVRALGGGGRLAEGAEASERLIKNEDLARYRILHLAVHAVVDDEHPDRSAVLLAPGEEREDGFLQVREIVDLELSDQVVILSACRSASGTVLRGGTMLGLGQGFLRAGARAVIGNLWPMRDEEAEEFVRVLANSLARGSSLAQAVTDARAFCVSAGSPSAEWAGMVVLGDGDFVPVPGGTRRGLLKSALRWPTLLAAIAVAAALATAALLLRRRMRHAAGSSTA